MLTHTGADRHVQYAAVLEDMVNPLLSLPQTVLQLNCFYFTESEAKDDLLIYEAFCQVTPTCHRLVIHFRPVVNISPMLVFMNAPGNVLYLQGRCVLITELH